MVNLGRKFGIWRKANDCTGSCARGIFACRSEPPNMSTSESTSPRFDQLDQHLWLLKAEDDPEAVIVFFHGLVMTMDETERDQAYWKTWKKRDSDECWPITLLPEYLEKKKEKYRIRVLAVCYEGRTMVPDVGTQDTDAYLLANNFITALVESDHCRGRSKKDVPIILVGHDMGGILIKNFVLKVDEKAAAADEEDKEKLESFLNNLKAVMFYATPHNGSQVIEDMAKKIPPDTQSQLLKLMSVLGADLSRVNAEFSKYRSSPDLGAKRFKTYALYSTHKTNRPEKGFNSVMVVVEASARYDVDDFYSVSGDHFQVCQPQGLWDSCMKRLGDKIHEEISLAREVEEIQRLPESKRNFPGASLQPLNMSMPAPA